jgi:cell division protein FtsL
MAMNKKLVYVILVVVLVFEVVIQQMTIAIQKETLQSVLEMSQNQQETIYLQEQENEILKQKLKELSSFGTPCRIPL